MAAFLRGEGAGKKTLSTDGKCLWSGPFLLAVRKGGGRIEERASEEEEPGSVRRHRKQLRVLLEVRNNNS